MISALYAATLGLLFVFLSFRTIGIRRSKQIGIGDGGHQELAKAARAHANFAEYTPIAILLILMLEQGGMSALYLHVLGSSLLLGRVVHAYGISRIDEDFRFRVLGMILTFSVILVAVFANFYFYFTH